MSECSNCPANHTSAQGGSCTACAAGYGAAAGASACTVCPLGQTSTPGGPCTPCPAGKFSYPAGAACTSCAAGFSSTAGASACTACPVGQTSTSGGTCVACPPGQSSSAGGTCMCPRSQYKNASGSCVNCNAGQTSDGVTCTSCPTGTTSVAGGRCEACAAGYSAASGAAACTACPVGQTSTSGGTCMGCPPGQISYPAGAPCGYCPVGYEKSGTTCVACPAGKSSDGAGGACMNCPVNKTSVIIDGRPSACINCPAGQTSVAGGACTDCPAGYSSASGGACAVCAAGYSSNSGRECEKCPEGFGSNSGDSQCYGVETGAPPGNRAAYTINGATVLKSATSICGPGTILDNGVCRPCAYGRVSNGLLSYSCEDARWTKVPNSDAWWLPWWKDLGFDWTTKWSGTLDECKLQCQLTPYCKTIKRGSWLADDAVGECIPNPDGNVSNFNRNRYFSHSWIMKDTLEPCPVTCEGAQERAIIDYYNSIANPKGLQMYYTNSNAVKVNSTQCDYRFDVIQLSDTRPIPTVLGTDYRRFTFNDADSCTKSVISMGGYLSGVEAA